LKGLNHRSFEFKFPQIEPPLWKDSVQRWYQLDACAYGLAEGAFRWRDLNRPDLVILASPLASNETDRLFIETGSGSPAKFAHTLPNIRCSPFCQVMEWSGPVLCFQRDPRTQIQGLIEGFELAGSQFPLVWILSVIRHEFHYKVHCLEVGFSPSELTIEKRLEKVEMDLLKDNELVHWLEKLEESVLKIANYEIKKESFK
jgi:hypothetical protein